MHPQVIDRFSDEYRWLSNFYAASVLLDGVEYRTVEHAYQAAKFRGNPAMQAKIRATKSPRYAKAFGKGVKPPGWHKVSLQIMEDLVEQKFRRHLDLQDKLLATGTAKLIEGNWWGDTFWGTVDGKGHNHLGKILMRVRKRLQAEREAAS